MVICVNEPDEPSGYLIVDEHNKFEKWSFKWNEVLFVDFGMFMEM